MKHLLAKIVACLALSGAVAVFAESGSSDMEADSTHESSSELFNMDIDDIEGKDVLDSNGDQLGDVDEIVKDKSNTIMAVIGLEDSMKEVVVPLTRLSLSTDKKYLTTRMTRTELLALPDYDPMDMESVDE